MVPFKIHVELGNGLINQLIPFVAEFFLSKMYAGERSLSSIYSCFASSLNSLHVFIFQYNNIILKIHFCKTLALVIAYVHFMQFSN